MQLLYIASTVTTTTDTVATTSASIVVLPTATTGMSIYLVDTLYGVKKYMAIVCIIRFVVYSLYSFSKCSTI